MKNLLIDEIMMKNYTSFGIGGRAKYCYFPEKEDEVVEFFQYTSKNKIKVYFIGGGTNILVTDKGINGAVLFSKYLNNINVVDNGDFFEAGAESGMPLAHLVTLGIKYGFAGVEKLAGIPGTIGGAVFGNAGLDKKGIGEFVTSVEIINSNGKKRILIPNKHFTLSYRETTINKDYFIYKVILSFKKGSPEKIKEKYHKIIVDKKEAQPMNEKTAGSVFKNPKNKNAWQLIDDAGFRGVRIGGARVSNKHTNFIVNEYNASSEDVISLMKSIKKKVKDLTKIELKEEIKILGEK